MKKITIRVPENKLPESHKEIVRKRIITSNANPELLQDWDKVKKQFPV